MPDYRNAPVVHPVTGAEFGVRYDALNVEWYIAYLRSEAERFRAAGEDQFAVLVEAEIKAIEAHARGDS